MDLTDRLLLLAVAADNDGWAFDGRGQPRVPARFQSATGGALLAELVLLGRITAGRRLRIADPTPTGDDEVDLALRIVLADGWRVRRCAATIAARRPDLVRLHRMRTRNLLHTYPARGTEWLFVRETTTAFEDVLKPLHAALDTGACDEPTRALLAVVRSCGLHEVWLKGLPPRERDRRLAELLADDWLPGFACADLPAIS